MKNIVLNIILFFICSLSALAQIPGFPESPNPEEDPMPAPIDNAVVVLLVAGIILGVYFMFKRKTIRST